MLWKIISIFPNVYDLGTRNFRNDLNRIAIPVPNGFLENDWIKKLPGSLYYTPDPDILQIYQMIS